MRQVVVLFITIEVARFGQHFFGRPVRGDRSE